MTYRTEDQVRDETNVPIHKLMCEEPMTKVTGFR